MSRVRKNTTKQTVEKSAVMGRGYGLNRFGFVVVVVLFAAIASYIVYSSKAAPRTTSLAYTLQRNPQIQQTAAESSIAALKTANYRPVSLQDLAATAQTDTTTCAANTFASVDLPKATVTSSFCWQNSALNTSSKSWWIPQGITGPESDKAAGLLLVSWLGKGEDTGRSRLSIVNLGKTPYQYRNVELVTTCSANIEGVCHHLNSPASGVVLSGDYLYVADEDGLLAFKTDSIYMSADSKKLVWPLAQKWVVANNDDCTGAKSQLLSGISLDASTSPHQLVSVSTTEAASASCNDKATVLRWNLGSDGTLVSSNTGDTATATSAHAWVYTAGTNNNIHGVASYKDHLLLSDTAQTVGKTGAVDLLHRFSLSNDDYQQQEDIVLPQSNVTGLFVDAGRDTVWAVTANNSALRQSRVLALPLKTTLGL